MRLALFQPDIPQNLGAAIRLTACLGVPLDVIEPCGFPLSDRALKRAAMDYAQIADVTRHPSWDSFRTNSVTSSARLVLFTTKGAEALHDVRFAASDILLFGRESAGVPEAVHAAARVRVVVPLVAGARSLNLVTAAAIGLAEALRQINAFPSRSPAS